MSESKFISTNFAAVLVYGRPPLVFGGMLFAVAVMLNQSLTAYIVGLCFLLTSMFFDLIDGWMVCSTLSTTGETGTSCGQDHG